MPKPSRKPDNSTSRRTASAGARGSSEVRDRQVTEERMLKTARRILDQEGVLSGLNLRRVADEAGVNRGLIYQYFGSRQALLRAALGERAWRELPIHSDEGRQVPFRQWRGQMFKNAVAHSRFIKLTALLVSDGDPNIRLWPELPKVMASMKRDVETGELPADADLMALHAIVSATIRGYSVFREAFAREFGVPQASLDEAVHAQFLKMLDGLTGHKDAEDAETQAAPGATRNRRRYG